MNVPDIAYAEVLRLAKESGEPERDYLRQELPYLWRDAYLVMSDRPTDILVFTYDSFDYLYDAYQPQEPYDPNTHLPPIEARLVAAIGHSQPKRTRRDDSRLRGMYLSAMPDISGPWDRGHYIAHSIGGTVDGNEANVFLQLRSANRGKYRIMESFCFKNPGVMCFSRPVYIDVSAHPARVDFGILKPDGELWVKSIPNRHDA
jgi:hypothetical protein